MRIDVLLGKIPAKKDDCSASSSKMVKVYFKEHDVRMPMVGKFVMMKDGTDLAKKSMVRFVANSRTDYWSDQNPQIGLTRIFNSNDFTQIVSAEIGN